MGNSHNTRLRIENHTNSDIVNTSVTGVDNYDWDGSRPDHNFNGVSIKSKGALECREELNAHARHCPFTITLRFRDGSVDTFRIHQKHAIGCCPGFNHMTRSHNIYYQRVGDNLLKITIENTEQQLQEQKAEQLNKEGEAALTQKQYETAMKKFDEALHLTNQSKTIGLIKINKANAYNAQGEAALQRGWEQEVKAAQDSVGNAKASFDQAKSLFQQALNLNKSSVYENNLKTVNLKIEGNRLFNEANELEKQAYQIFEDARNKQSVTNYTDSQNKYKEALNKYKQAKTKFDEGVKMGDTRFENCSTIIEQQIENVSEVIDEIDKAELIENINETTAEEDKDKDDSKHEQDEKNMHEQIEIIASI